MSELYPEGGGAIEEILGEHGVYASVVCGSSMRPMLKAGRDVVCIFPISKPPRKYDVLLYKRGERYILHRIIGFYPEGYIIRGDNTYKKEYVKKDAAVGVLGRFNRLGREYSSDGFVFYLYGMLVQLFYLPRFCLVSLKHILERKLKKQQKEN